MRLFNFSGARPTKAANLIVSPSPSGLIAVDDTSGEVAWCTEMETTSYTRHNSLAVSPAAFAGGHFFTGTKDGRLLCVSPQTGEVVWEERVNGPIKHEPVVAKGRIYVCSGRKLYCFDTEDPKIDGWPMWGGAITRNK